jgi:hypothetical protein
VKQLRILLLALALSLGIMSATTMQADAAPVGRSLTVTTSRSPASPVKTATYYANCGGSWVCVERWILCGSWYWNGWIGKYCDRCICLY